MRESTANVLHSFTLLLQKLTLWLGSKTQALLAVQESLRRGARDSPRTRGAPEPTGEPGALHRALLTSLPPWALLRLHWNLRGMKLLDTPPGPAHLCPRAPRGDLERRAGAGRPAGRSQPGVTLPRLPLSSRPSSRHSRGSSALLPDHGVTTVSPGSDAGGHRGQRPRLLEEPNCKEKGVLQPPTSVNVENIRN